MDSGMASLARRLRDPFSAVGLAYGVDGGKRKWLLQATASESWANWSSRRSRFRKESVPEGVVPRATAQNESANLGVLTVNVLVDPCGGRLCEVGLLKLLLELSDLGLRLTLEVRERGQSVRLVC